MNQLNPYGARFNLVIPKVGDPIIKLGELCFFFGD